MSRRIETLRNELAQHRVGRSGQGVRYPEPLRTAVARMAKARLQAGESLASVARQLALPPATLERWMPQETAPAFRTVEVAELDGLEDEGGRLALLTPAGYRVEGLSPAQIVEILDHLDARK